MNLKRIGTLLLAAAMSASFMAGCGDQPAQSSGSQPESSKSESSAAQSETSEFSYPTTGSLTFWQWADGNVGANFASFEDTPAAGYAEEATGVKVDYIDDHSNTDEAFQLMTTSDKLPDLIGHGWLGYNGGIVAAYEDGLCIRLNEVIDQYMPNFKALLDANPDVKKMASDDEGNIYFIPLVGAYSSLYTYGSYVRTDMLEKVGGQVPSTIDGWHDLLTAVKNEYGIAPFTTTWGDLLTMSFVSYAYGVGNTEYVVGSDGNAVYNRTGDHYKAFLETLHQWFEEGLLDPDIATIALADSRAKVINGEAFASGGWLGSGVQPVEQASDEWGILAVAPPALREGETPDYTYTNWRVSGQGVVISPDCENVELAARWMDYFFSDEGVLLFNYGKEGVSYTMVDGKPTFTDDVLYNFPEGWTQTQSIAAHNFVSNSFNAGLKDENYYPQTIVEQSCKDAIEIWSNVKGGGFDHKWPNVSYTSDEAAEMARYSTNLKTAADEWALNFVIGTTGFDQWDAYIAELESLGAKEALEINQAALVRYNAR